MRPMIRNSAISNFSCLRHKAHTKCVGQYLKSDMAKKTNYLCIFKCSEPSVWYSVFDLFPDYVINW
jgi:hypothetical protein